VSLWGRLRDSFSSSNLRGGNGRVERNRWSFIVLGRCEGIVLSLRLEAKARLIAGQYFFEPSFLKGCAQITPERRRVLVKVFPSYNYIFQASEEKAQLISRSQVRRFQYHSSLKNRLAIFSRSVCIYKLLKKIKAPLFSNVCKTKKKYRRSLKF